MELQKKLGVEISNLFSCPSSFFLEKKEIRKRQGRYKGCISERNNMDPDRVTGEMGIIGSNRESILYLLHLRLWCCSVLLLLIQYWVVPLAVRRVRQHGIGWCEFTSLFFDVFLHNFYSIYANGV